jgi:hypothetical protein
MHGWPVSPDFALYLIQLLEQNNYDLIIELGSGTSTTLIAKVLEKIAKRRPDGTKPIQVAFEHLEQYYTKTCTALRQAGLETSVELILAPLEPYTGPNGENYSYYDCQDVLAKLAGNLPKAPLNVFVLVDGPPGSTGKHPRYPALPVIMKHFPDATLNILLDDYARPDEMEIFRMWKEEASDRKYATKITEIPLEKGASLIVLSNRPHM